MKGHPNEHFCKIILKSGHLPRKRSHLKLFSILTSGGHFVQWSGTALAILVKDHFFEIVLKSTHQPTCRRICCFYDFFIFSSGGHFVMWTISLSNFGDGSPKEHFCEIKLRSYHSPRRCCLKVVFFFFNFYLWWPFCSAELNCFVNFGKEA